MAMCTAIMGSNRWASLMRWASETRRNRAPSPSKLQGRPFLDKRQAGFVMTVEEFVGELAGSGLVGEFEGLGAEPLDADHRHQGVWQDAADGCVGLKLFKPHGQTISPLFVSREFSALQGNTNKANDNSPGCPSHVHA